MKPIFPIKKRFKIYDLCSHKHNLVDRNITISECVCLHACRYVIGPSKYLSLFLINHNNFNSYDLVYFASKPLFQ
jgi:hypothetical protein